MNNKKIISFFLITSLFTTPITALAATKSSLKDNTELSLKTNETLNISKEKAKELSKETLEKYFKVKLDDKNFKCNISMNSYKDNNLKQHSFWNIYWYSKSFDNETMLSISIDANTSKILSMNNNSSNNTFSIPKLSMEKAKKISDNLIKKINPSEYKDVALIKDDLFFGQNNSSHYSFKYVRTISKAKYYSNYIYVTINGSTGDLKSYSFKWNNDLKIPNVPKTNLEKSIKDKFKSEMDMNLKYELFKNKYEYQDSKNVALVYEPYFKDNYIDAVTGEFLKDEYNNFSMEKVNLTKDEKNNFYNSYKNCENFKEPLSKEEASKLILNKIQKLYGKEYILDTLNYSENTDSYKSNSAKIWYANFKDKNNKDNTKYGYMKINALNGEIICANISSSFEYKEKFTPKISFKEGYLKAIDLIKEYYPSKIKNLNLELTHKKIIDKENKDKEIERFYDYCFTRKVNNTPYSNDSIYIEFNTKTCEPTSISCSWDNNIKFENPNKKISIDKAKEAYFNKYKPELVLIWDDGKNDKEKPQLKFVYTLNTPPIYIDAFTGNILNNYDGEEIQFDVSKFLNEIKGSKIEKEIKILAYKGLIDTNNFKLKKEITNMDLIKTLVDALGYTPYIINKSSNLGESLNKDSSKEKNILSKEDYIKMASYYGFIENTNGKFDPYAKVTRENMCKSLIKFLNYETIAECKGIFALKCSDSCNISKDSLGYVSLAKGLNLIQLDDNNNLNPKTPATMEDLSLGIFKALENKDATYNNIYR